MGEDELPSLPNLFFLSARSNSRDRLEVVRISFGVRLEARFNSLLESLFFRRGKKGQHVVFFFFFWGGTFFLSGGTYIVFFFGGEG